MVNHLTETGAAMGAAVVNCKAALMATIIKSFCMSNWLLLCKGGEMNGYLGVWMRTKMKVWGRKGTEGSVKKREKNQRGSPCMGLYKGYVLQHGS